MDSITAPSTVRDYQGMLASHILYVATLALSGLRTGEVAALNWQDLDLDGGSIQVNKPYCKGVLGEPKTGASFRSVPIYPRLATVLSDHRSGIRKWRLARGAGAA